MKKIFLISIIGLVIFCVLLFIQGRYLMKKFGPPHTNKLPKSIQGLRVPEELLYSLRYDKCVLQHRNWSGPDRVCVIEYPDGGKICNNGSDCKSGVCILDEDVFRNWTAGIFKPSGSIDPNASVSNRDKLEYPTLPDTILGTCTNTNICDYGGAVIRVDDGIRHAVGASCGQI